MIGMYFNNKGYSNCKSHTYNIMYCTICCLVGVFTMCHQQDSLIHNKLYIRHNKTSNFNPGHPLCESNKAGEVSPTVSLRILRHACQHKTYFALTDISTRIHMIICCYIISLANTLIISNCIVEYLKM